MPAINSGKFYFPLLIIFFFASIDTKANSFLQPNGLTCEYRENPLGIDVVHPYLSWILLSGKRSLYQSAYELIVSDNLNDIQLFRGNVWESGMNKTTQNLNIEYKGSPLQSFVRYYWRVKVYDQDGQPSEWSQPAWFETAMLHASDWKAQWIGDGSKQFEQDEDFYREDPMPLFRKQINIKKKIKNARLYISGLGYYEAYLNQKKIGDYVLAPGFTSYKKQVLYNTYDITSQLIKGNNIIGLMLGNGWYNPLPLRLFGRFNLRDAQETGRPCVKAQLLIRYEDGSSEIVITDGSWGTAPGPVTRNNVYLGEHYDARLENPDWFSERSEGWKAAIPVKGPSGVLNAEMQPPIKVTAIIKPVAISQAGKDTFIFDMGQNFAGVARLKINEKSGTKITLRYGEDLFPDGKLNYLTTVAGQIKAIWNLKGGPGAPATAWQEDSYICKGGSEETWSPRFTFHGFRYVEITGLSGRPILNNMEGLRLSSDLRQDGVFTCSNEMFNKLNEVIKWTFLSNVFSIQSDCPGREKMGYGGDMVATSQSFIYNFNMCTFYRKSINDFENDQQPGGGITETAPYTGIADKGIGEQSGPLGWQLAFPYLQKQLYDYYGDKRILENSYQAFQKQINYLQSKSSGDLFYWDISDHEALDPKPESFSASAFYYHHVLLATEFAGILGKTNDSLEYARLAARIKDALVNKYWIPGTGRFDNATQSAELFALWYGLSPVKDSSFAVFLNELTRHNWHLYTGIFSTQMAFNVLRENERNDIAYRIVNQKDYPGWGYMLSKGATTLWETWAYTDNVYSHNHPMFGSVSEWFYRSILGINALEPGFKRVMIKPQPAEGLTWAKGSYHSVMGTIISEWKRDKGKFILHISIPANTSGEIWMPLNNKEVVSEGGKPLLNNPDLKLNRYEKGYAVIDVNSGDYSFISGL